MARRVEDYIPTRYPNGFDWGAPMDYFAREDAERAVATGIVLAG